MRSNIEMQIPLVFYRGNSCRAAEGEVQHSVLPLRCQHRNKIIVIVGKGERMEPSEQLQKINLYMLSHNITDQHKNFIVNHVNGSCLRLAVLTGEYPWHFHPASDELFMVLEGELFIDFQNRDTVILKPDDIFTIPAGIIHRTRAIQRTVNICFEQSDATTEFLEGR